MVDKLKYQLHTDGVSFQTSYCASEDFPNTVLNKAQSNDSDLIVLTANLEYDFKSYFVGPYSQQIVNHSRIPVLSIKPVPEKSQPLSMLKLSESWGDTINFSELQTE